MKCILIFMITGILIAALLLAGCSVEDGNPQLTTFVGADYVGSIKCKECHAGLYEGWRETLHPYKVQKADTRTIVGDFHANNELTAGGYTTKMFEKDGKYYVTTLDNNGEEKTFEIVYTLGGNQWKQRYMTVFPNGGIYILPVQWNMDTEEWVDYHGLKNYQPGDSGYWASPTKTWQYNCAGCHVTGVKLNHATDPDNFKTEWVDFGAGCEACHGPGSNHVDATEENRAATIVNPDRLNFNMGVEVCGSCHNRGKSPDGNFGYPANFIPGLGANSLTHTYTSVAPDSSSFWGTTEDSKSHHQQYLDYLKSKHAETGVACWDCHDPHSAGDSNKFSLKLPGGSICKACHGEQREVPELQGLSHTIHDFGSCVDCHMPATAKSALPGDIRSHTFKVIEPQVTIDALVDGAMNKDEAILNFYGLTEGDVEGLNRTEVNALLEEKALEAMEAEKPLNDLLWQVQPNSCYGSPLRTGCHNDISPWVLQPYLKSPILQK